MELIKYSALTITYNQEKYVKEMIESVMNQSILPYEFIISDDCSTDNTWNIIQEYKQKFPEIIKAIQHETNQGLYKNLNFALSQVTGDVLCALGGDDFFAPDLFLNLTMIIGKENINVKNDSFIIVTNTAHYYPNGKITFWNNYKLKNKKLFKEQLRGGVSLRWIGYSTKLLPHTIAPENLGYGADWYRNAVLYLNCHKYYYADFISTYYRVGVGVTSKLKIKQFAEHSKSAIPVFLELYKDKLSSDDLLYLKFAQSLNKFQLNGGFINYIKAIWLFIINSNNFSINNGFIKQLKIFIPFKSLLYKFRKVIYKY